MVKCSEGDRTGQQAQHSDRWAIPKCLPAHIRVGQGLHARERSCIFHTSFIRAQHHLIKFLNQIQFPVDVDDLFSRGRPGPVGYRHPGTVGQWAWARLQHPARWRGTAKPSFGLPAWSNIKKLKQDSLPRRKKE